MPPAPVEFFVASAASGAATLLGNPFEVAKTRLQLQRTGGGAAASAAAAGAAAAAAAPPAPRYRHSLHAIWHIARAEGLRRGLYAGFGAFAAYRVAMNGARIGLYEPTKAALLRQSELGQLGPFGQLLLPPGGGVRLDVLAAVPTGALGAVLGNPFQVVKTRMMHVGTRPPPEPAELPPARRPQPPLSMLGTAARVLRTEGPAAFALGLGAAVPRVVVGSTSQLVTYDALKRRFAGRRPTDGGGGGGGGGGRPRWWEHAVCAVAASGVSTTCFCPFDMASTRMYARHDFLLLLLTHSLLLLLHSFPAHSSTCCNTPGTRAPRRARRSGAPGTAWRKRCGRRASSRCSAGGWRCLRGTRPCPRRRWCSGRRCASRRMCSGRSKRTLKRIECQTRVQCDRSD